MIINIICLIFFSIQKMDLLLLWILIENWLKHGKRMNWAKPEKFLILSKTFQKWSKNANQILMMTQHQLCLKRQSEVHRKQSSMKNRHQISCIKWEVFKMILRTLRICLVKSRNSLSEKSSLRILVTNESCSIQRRLTRIFQTREKKLSRYQENHSKVLRST